LKNKVWIYVGFFALLIGIYLFALRNEMPFQKAPLAVINDSIPDFQLIDQNGKSFTKKETEGKVYVAEYFFTTCKAICPKMNANMRRIYDKFQDLSDFIILSHTCQPEVDSVSLLKAYEEKMLKGRLVQRGDGSYSIDYTDQDKMKPLVNANWKFLTGDKSKLYDLARYGYVIDNQKPDSTQKIENQFIHTQFFALVDRYGRVRGIYDGLKEDEIEKLMKDIPQLMDEKVEPTRFVNGFSNTPQ
jgi:protein SCO1/2